MDRAAHKGKKVTITTALAEFTFIIFRYIIGSVMKTPKRRFLSLIFACLWTISDQNMGDICLTYQKQLKEMSPKQQESVSGTVKERLKVKRCENLKKGHYVRSGIRTHASIRRPEHSLPLRW